MNTMPMQDLLQPFLDTHEIKKDDPCSIQESSSANGLDFLCHRLRANRSLLLSPVFISYEGCDVQTSMPIRFIQDRILSS